jgi:hypothetical protein
MTSFGSSAIVKKLYRPLSRENVSSRDIPIIIMTCVKWLAEYSDCVVAAACVAC